MKPKRLFLASTICFACTPMASAADRFWDNSGGTANDWGSVPNWSTVVGGGTNPAALPGTGDVAVFSATSLATAQTVNLNADRSVGGLRFTSSFTHALLGGGTNRALTLGTSGITVNSGAGAVTIGSVTAGQQVAVTLGGAQTWANNSSNLLTVVNGISGAHNLTVNGTGSTTLSGAITTGAGTLTKSGSNTTTLTLSGTNTFTGNVNISNGIIKITNSSALGVGPKTIAITNGTAGNPSLQLDGAAGAINLASNIAINTSSVGSNGAIRNLAGDNTIAGTITMTAGGGDSHVYSDAGTLTLSGTITANTTGRGLVLRGASTGANTVSGVINNTSTPRVEKQDAGLWVLTNTNTYGGGTTVSAGTLRGTVAGAFGAGTMTLAGGSLDLFNNTGTNFGRNTTVTGNATVISNRAAAGAGVAHTLGTLSIGAQTLSVTRGANATSGTGTVVFGATTLTGDSTFSPQANAALTLGAVSGAFNLSKTGAGTLNLGAANTFTGLLTVSDGAVSLSNAGALGANANVVVENAQNPATTDSNVLRLSGGLVYGAGKTLTLRNNSTTNIPNARAVIENQSGNNEWAGDIVFEGGLNQTITSAAGNLLVSGDISQGITASTSVFVRGNGNGEITGAIDLGTATFYKTDGGTWTVSSAGNVHGAVQVGNGTLVANATNALDTASSLILGEGNPNNTTFRINDGFTQEFAAISNDATSNVRQTISGPGSLSTGSTNKVLTVNNGTSAVDITLSAPVSGTGTLIVAGAGHLVLDQVVSSAPVSLTNGSVTIGPAALTGFGTFDVASLNLTDTTLNLDLGTDGDSVETGGLTASGLNVINLRQAGSLPAGSYPLITYTGASPGVSSFVIGAEPPRAAGVLSDSGTAIVYTTANTSVYWTGDLTSVWATGATDNWKQTSDDVVTDYFEGDEVVFADGATTGSVEITGNVVPGDVKFTNVTDSYNLFGAGGITGATQVAKSGNGTVTLNGTAAHSYTGATTISAGVLSVNQAASGITGTSGVSISSGAELELFSNNADFTFNRNLSGSGVLRIDGVAGGTPGTAGTVRGVTLSGVNTGFSGEIILEASGDFATNGSYRVLGNVNALGTADIVVNDRAQMWTTGASSFTNNLTITGAGNLETAGGTPAFAATGADGSTPTVPGFAYGGIGAIRMDSGQTLAGNITLAGDAKITAYNGTGTLSGMMGTTNASDTLVIGGAGAGTNLFVTGDASGLGRIWVNGGGSAGTNQLIIGNGGTTGSLGSGDVVLYQDAAGGQLRIDRSDGYTLGVGQKIIAAHNGTATNLSRAAVTFNTAGTGFSNAGNTIDLSDGTNRGTLQVGNNVAGANARLTGTIDVGQTTVGVLNGGIPTTGATLSFGTVDGLTATTVTSGPISLAAGGGGTPIGNTAGAVLNIHGGTTLTGGSLQLGEQLGSGATVNQFGGSASVARILVGHWGSETSIYNLSDGTLNITDPAPGTTPSVGGSELSGGIYLGIDGTGVFNQSGGTVSTNYVLLDSRGNTGVGTNMVTGIDQYNLSAGVFELKSGYGIVGRNASTELNLSGGTVRNTGADGTDVSVNVLVNAASATTTTLDTVNGTRSFSLMGNVLGAGTLALSGGGVIELQPDSNATRTEVSTGTGTQTIAATLSGSNPITKLGTGTSILSGASPAYNGDLTILAGRLDLTGATAAALEVADGGTLSGEGSVASLTLGSAVGGALSVNPLTPTAFVTTDLAVVGTAVVSLQSSPVDSDPIPVLQYTTATGVLPAQFELQDASSYRTATFAVSGGLVTLNPGVVDQKWTGETDNIWEIGGTLPNWSDVSGLFYRGDTVTFDDTGINPSINLLGALRPASITVDADVNAYSFNATTGNVIAGDTGLLKKGTAVLTMAGNIANTFTGGTVVSEGTINVQNAGSLGTGAVVLGDASTGSGNVALYLDTNRIGFGGSVLVANQGTGTATLGSRSTVIGTGDNNQFTNVTLARDVVFDSNAADRTDYENVTGTGNITVTGTGRTLFMTANTFVGNLTVNVGVGGSFQFGTATAGNQNYIPDTTSVTVNDTVGATFGEFRVSVGGETIAGLSGNGTVDVNSINGTLSVGFGDVSSTFDGQFVNGGANTLGVTKIGAGTLTLTGNSTTTGLMNVTAGSLVIGTGGTSGSIGGALTVATGASATLDRSDASVLAGALNGAGTLNKDGAGDLSLNAGGAFSGTINVLEGSITANVTNPWNTALVAPSFTLAPGTVLSNTGTSAHAHVGAITMAGGSTWTTGSGTASYDGENYQLNNTVTVLGGSTAALITREGGRTDGNSGIALRGNITFNVGNVTGSAAADLIVSTELENTDAGTVTAAGAGSLTKSGVGTMVLEGSQNYSGTTTVSEGVLAVNGSVNGVGAVTVAASGTLSGDGSVAGAATVLGTLSPGMAIGDLDFGSTVDLQASSTLRAEITGLTTHDKIISVGAVTAAGSIEVVLDGYVPSVGNTFNLVTAPSITGTPTFDFDEAVLPSGLAWDTSDFNTTGSISIISSSAYDAWEELYGLTEGKFGDDDGDGVANILEFATNADPTDGGSGARVFSRVHEIGGVDVLTYTVAVREDATFAEGDPDAAKQEAVKDGVEYTIEASDDLVSWSTVVVTELDAVTAAAVRAAITPALPTLEDGWEWHTFRTDGDASIDAEDFIRLSVEAP
jgi:autotransporter-associated beta strand protein